MFIIGENPLCDTDDYDRIQAAYEGYLYGTHRGLDVDEKELKEWYKFDYLYIEMEDLKKFKNGEHKIIK